MRAQVLFLGVCVVGVTMGLPQYQPQPGGGSGGAPCCGPAPGGPAPPAPAIPAPPAPVAAAPAPAPGPTGPAYSSSASSSPSGLAPSGGGGGSSSSGGSGSQVQCQSQQMGPGSYKFVCTGADPNALTLKNTHILWIPGAAGQNQNIDIDVPNYKVQELIQAGFKNAGGNSNTQINIKLKKPDQSYDAQIDQQPGIQSNPQVNLQYEPVADVHVHYPNDKPYSPLSGPLTPPAGGSSSSSSSSSSAGPGSSLTSSSFSSGGGGGGSAYRPQRQIQQVRGVQNHQSQFRPIPQFAQVVYHQN